MQNYILVWWELNKKEEIVFHPELVWLCHKLLSSKHNTWFDTWTYILDTNCGQEFIMIEKLLCEIMRQFMIFLTGGIYSPYQSIILTFSRNWRCSRLYKSNLQIKRSRWRWVRGDVGSSATSSFRGFILWSCLLIPELNLVCPLFVLVFSNCHCESEGILTCSSSLILSFQIKNPKECFHPLLIVPLWGMGHRPKHAEGI